MRTRSTKPMGAILPPVAHRRDAARMPSRTADPVRRGPASPASGGMLGAVTQRPAAPAVADLPAVRPRCARAGRGRGVQALVEREPVPAAAVGARRDLRRRGGRQPLPRHVRDRAHRGDRGATSAWTPRRSSRAPARSRVLGHVLSAVVRRGRRGRLRRGARSRRTRSRSPSARAERRPGPGRATTAGSTSPAMAAAVTPRTRAVLVCTPNNPTGPAVRADELATFLDAGPRQRPRRARRGLRRVRPRPARSPTALAVLADAPERRRAADVLQGVRARGPARRVRGRPAPAGRRASVPRRRRSASRTSAQMAALASLRGQGRAAGAGRVDRRRSGRACSRACACRAGRCRTARRTSSGSRSGDRAAAFAQRGDAARRARCGRSRATGSGSAWASRRRPTLLLEVTADWLTR